MDNTILDGFSDELSSILEKSAGGISRALPTGRGFKKAIEATRANAAEVALLRSGAGKAKNIADAAASKLPSPFSVPTPYRFPTR
jgi:hypothetical protein